MSETNSQTLRTAENQQLPKPNLKRIGSILESPERQYFCFLTLTVRLTNVLRINACPQTVPSAPKKRRQIKWQHDDGVGGNFKYESNETTFTNSEIYKETTELLSEVTVKLAEMQIRLKKLDYLQLELERLCKTAKKELADAR